MAKNQRKKDITVGFVALGCPKNIVDSEKMLAEIAQGQFLITADHREADVVVINTCGFIAPAKEEAFEVIREALKCKSEGAVKKVIVAGCLAERMGKEMLREVDGIDGIVGLGYRDRIANIIDETIEAKKTIIYLDKPPDFISDDRERLSVTPRHWSYLRISEGCDHKCSFCTIPAIKGRFRSKPQKLVLSEAAELVSAGAVELNVIAQDTAYWGKDRQIKDGLAGLLKELEKIEGLKWIRLLYLYPIGITDSLIKTIAESETINHYVDMPIQHINDAILKQMHRPDTKERICELVERLRSKINGIVLRTTVITGFPGETDEQFEELLEFVKWARFDALGAFIYYREEGTEAAKMVNQVPEKVKQERFGRLMRTQQEIAFEKNEGKTGAELTCLVDSVSQVSGQGRYYGQAPEIDSVCIIKNCSAKPGELIKTNVVGTKDYDLVVEQI